MESKRKIISTIFLAASAMIALLSVAGLIYEEQLPWVFYAVLIALAFLLLVAGIRLRNKTGRITTITMVAAMILLIYIVAESAVNVMIWTKVVPDEIPALDLGFGVFNGPCADYDPVRGYKWKDGDWRISKILNKSVVYDRRFRPNDQGIYFNIDYKGPKQDTSKGRYIVFGDSFTSGEYLDKPWPLYFNELAAADGMPIELYSFAVNGGGLHNWHSIFFKEIISGYEFDGIILAIFTNDLHRDFFVMEHMEDAGYTGYLDTIPQDRADLVNNYFDRLNPYAPYMADSIIDQKRDEAIRHMQAGFIFKPRPHVLTLFIALPILYKQKKDFKAFMLQHLMPEEEIMSLNEAEEAIGPAKARMFNEMITWCRDNEKDIILASLPYEPAFKYMKQGMILNQYGQCMALADYHSLAYFDGLESFSALSADELEASFFPYDVHWSQTGSNYFTEAFYKYFSLHYPH